MPAENSMDKSKMAATKQSEKINTENVEGLESGITPCFIMANEIGARLSGYNIGCMINEQFQDRIVEGIQEVRGLWRVYTFTEQGKLDLCNQGLNVGHKKVKVHLQNPFVTGAINSGSDNIEDDRRVKLTIKDLYKSVSADSITHRLTKVYKLTLSSEVKMGNCRDDQGNLTYMMNYDRYVYVHPDQLIIPLPRNAQCGTFKCRIVYKGQFGPEQECWRCFATDHLSRNCPNPRACKVCKQPGHQPGHPDCDWYTTNENMRAYGGDKDPLSNHFKCDFEYNHVPLKSVEHGWFNQKGIKNGQTELATMCLEAEDAKSAKFLSHGIRCTQDWDQQPYAYNVMKSIAKAKFEQVEIAKEALKECWENRWSIVEAVPSRDTWWGSGLNKEATIHTDPKYWPGANTMGKILTEIMFDLFGPYPEYWEGEEDHGFAEMGQNVHVQKIEPKPPVIDIENSSQEEHGTKT